MTSQCVCLFATWTEQVKAVPRELPRNRHNTGIIEKPRTTLIFMLVLSPVILCMFILLGAIRVNKRPLC